MLVLAAVMSVLDGAPIWESRGVHSAGESAEQTAPCVERSYRVAPKTSWFWAWETLKLTRLRGDAGSSGEGEVPPARATALLRVW